MDGGVTEPEEEQMILILHFAQTPWTAQRRRSSDKFWRRMNGGSFTRLLAVSMTI
jgi:hypothetical protein